MSRTHDELCKMLPHVFYVFQQASSFAAWHSMELTRPGVVQMIHDHLIIRNATLESTLVSLRTLNEFFKPMDPKKKGKGAWDDCRAEDFPGYTRLGPFLDDALEKELHKRLAHLSWKRLEPHPGWQAGRLIHLGIDRVVDFLLYLKGTFLPWDHRLMPTVNGLLAEFEMFTPQGRLFQAMEDCGKK